MYTASPRVQSFGSRLTVVIEGSFDRLNHGWHSMRRTAHAGGKAAANRACRRRLSCWDAVSNLPGTADLEDIVRRAQLSEGSVRCCASTEGFILLLVDNTLVWSRQYDPGDPDPALWLEAARIRDVTIISDGLQARRARERLQRRRRAINDGEGSH